MSSSRTRKRKIILTDVHRRMYALEKDENFRWIYKLLASRFPEPLPPSALVDASIEHELATIGQFAELAHGSVSPPFVWANLEALMRERYPLEGYTELRGSRLLETFVGNVANLQGYMAHRPAQKQLVVAFSGTSALCQVRHELNICLVPHPDLRHESRGAKVHAGFFRLYTGLRTMVMGGLRRVLLDLEGEVEEVIVTGHSLGGVMACFFLLDLLRLGDSEDWWSPQRLTLKLATFGSPRLGNTTFVQAYKMVAANFRLTYGEGKLKEYAVRGYNDGVPCLPMNSFGYAHLHQSILYLHHGRLYHVPERALEYTLFDIIDDINVPLPLFPLGGHNYYNNRDMEKCLRHLGWIDMVIHGNDGWEERYLMRLRREIGENI